MTNKSKNDSINLSNMDVVNGEYLVVKINPKIYSLDIVQSAAYVLMDRAFAIIDGDPNKELVVELKPREKKEDLEKLGRDFNNELINYAVYKIQSKRTLPLREKIIQRALLTNLDLTHLTERQEKPIISSNQFKSPRSTVCEPGQEQDYGILLNTDPNVESDYIEDSDGITQSWDEKHNEDGTQKQEESLVNSSQSTQDKLDVSKNDSLKEDIDSETDYFDDPEGIAVPWDEKHKK